MKELILFRFFALFPFIGMVVPDASDAFSSSFSTITSEHLIVEITLLICLLTCSAGLWFFEMEKLKISSGRKKVSDPSNIPAPFTLGA